MHITALYASLLTILYVVLSLRVIQLRRTVRIALGDEGNSLMRRRLRAHGNFAEYVPLGLILMGTAESQAAYAWIVHLIGIVLSAGRVVHAYGVGREPEVRYCRVVGMGLTFTALLTGVAVNFAIWSYS